MNVNRPEASESAILNSLNLPAGTSMTVVVIFISVMKQTKLIDRFDTVLFCLNPLKLKPYFLILIDM